MRDDTPGHDQTGRRRLGRTARRAQLVAQQTVEDRRVRRVARCLVVKQPLDAQPVGYGQVIGPWLEVVMGREGTRRRTGSGSC
ncbi:hypothetical protein ACFSZS_17790 [Seohaeicola zhoushanensis]